MIFILLPHRCFNARPGVNHLGVTQFKGYSHQVRKPYH